jgi:hypothetical protein
VLFLSTGTPTTKKAIKKNKNKHRQAPASDLQFPTQSVTVMPTVTNIAEDPPQHYSNAPIKDDREDEREDEDLATRLRHRRLEIDHEIEEFKKRKEFEFQRFKEGLVAEAKLRRESKKEDLNKEATREEANKKEVPYSPPFEKELQVAGLFAPCYLPLLEDRRSSIMEDLQDSQASRAPHGHSPPKSPTSASPTSTSPVPLASSLKSSSGSFFGTGNSSDGSRKSQKPKSPKKVTFQFDDESTVPSRSSPPPTKVVWPFGPIDDGNFENENSDYGPYDEELAFENGEIEHVENVTGSGSGTAGSPGYAGTAADPLAMVSSFDNQTHYYTRSHGDQLITPLAFGSELQPDNHNPSTSPMAASGSSGNWTSQLATTSKTTNGMAHDSDSDDGGLFDLDETVPDLPEQSPPTRDYSPLMDAQLAAQANNLNLNPRSSLSASFSASIPRGNIPASLSRPSALTNDPLTFGKSPLRAPVSPFSSSFSFNPSGRAAPTVSLHAHTASAVTSTAASSAGGIPSSLPTWGFHPPAAQQDNSRFRRRSINKYIPSPPPEEEAEAAAKGTDDEPPATSIYGSSLPMAITPRLSSLRSPPASMSPVNPSPRRVPEVDRTPSPMSGLQAVLTSGAAASPAIGISGKLDTASILAEGGAEQANNSQVDSYIRTQRFPSATMSSYKTKYAEELAKQLMREGGAEESVVGGVDGRTGLDPGSFSVRGRGSYMEGSRFGSVAGGQRLSIAGGSYMGSLRGSVAQGQRGYSLSARMAEEDELEEEMRRRP